MRFGELVFLCALVLVFVDLHVIRVRWKLCSSTQVACIEMCGI
jgi:hypothetical protein